MNHKETRQAELEQSPAEIKAYSRSGLIVALGVLIVLGAGGYWLGRTLLVDSFANAHLEVDADELDFGESWSCNDFVWTIRIRNPTSKNIRIEDLRTSCSCLSIEPRAMTIRPDESVAVKLKLDLTTNDPKKASLPVRDFSTRIIPIVKDGLAQHSGWEIRGKVRNAYVLSAPYLDFGDDLAVGETVQEQSVDVMFQESVDRLELSYNRELLRVESEPNTDDSNRFRAMVRPLPAREAGELEATVSFIGVRGDSEKLYGSPLRILGRVVSDVQVIPQTLALGRVTVGERVEYPIVLRSRSGTPLGFHAVNCDGNPSLEVQLLSNTSDALQPQHALRLACVPREPGLLGCELKLVVKSDVGIVETPLTITCFGVASTDPRP